MGLTLGSAFSVATSSMLAKQKQLSVVSTNIANSDNSNYHRRSISLESIDLSGSNTFGGTGVFIAQVSRIYDAALETNLRSSTSSNSYYSNSQSRLAELESVLGPDGNNYLSERMISFMDSLQAVAMDPASVSYRTSLISAASTLSSEFNNQYSNMAMLRNTIAANDSTGSGSLLTQLDGVNNLLVQLAELNENIYNVENIDYRNQQALDLRDQRDALVKSLSEYMDISVKEENNSQYTVSMKLDDGSSVVLLDGTTIPQAAPEQLKLRMVEAPAGFFSPQIELASVPGVGLDLNSEMGSLRALMDSREYISTQMDRLFDYAKTLADEVNALQNNASAYDLDGNNNAGNLFVIAAAQPASGSILSVSPTITARKIAAADTTGQSGNGNNALAIWNRLNDGTVYNNESLSDFSERILSNVAVAVNAAKSSAETASHILTMYQNAVAEKSSVSMDEEMVDMLEVQKAFQAAAKMVNAIDKMIEVVINLV